jgi:hypothetical protein
VLLLLLHSAARRGGLVVMVVVMWVHVVGMQVAVCLLLASAG